MAALKSTDLAGHFTHKVRKMESINPAPVPVSHQDVQAKVEARKWFYTDVVKEHFFNPKNIFKTDEEAIAYEKEANGVGQVGSPACGDAMKIWLKIDEKSDTVKELKWQTFGSLLPGASIMMKDFSTKPVEKINIGDELMGGDGNINYAEEVLVRDYSGKIINLKLSTSSFYNIAVTPNHPIPAIKRKEVALIHRTSGGRWSEVSSELAKQTESYVVSAMDLEAGDFLLFNIPLQTEDKTELSEDICTLLGYYVSDGSLPSKNRVIFYFGLGERDYVKEIEAIAKRNNWKYVSYKRNTENVYCVQINEPEVVRIMRVHGGMPSQKNFSTTIMKLSPHKQMKIIDAYVNGDGWITKQKDNWNEQYFISTSKEHLANQLQIMLSRNGIFAPLHKRPAREFIIRGKSYKNSGEINLIFKKNQRQSRIKFSEKEASFLIPLSKVDIINYSGKIYDIGLVYAPNTYRVNGITLHNCASAIASTSMLSVMVTENGGLKVDQALELKPKDIVNRLVDLPSRKFHCSVLGDKALRAAINDYFKRTGQTDRIKIEGARIIDADTKTTDKDIEEAVLEGAHDFDSVQKKLKVGIANKAIIPEVEDLIRFYKEKYFG